MEQVAQELYRVVLFAVFFLEIYIISFLPYVGELRVPLACCYAILDLARLKLLLACKY